MSKITFIPVGGLANRMRSMASAISLAAQARCELEIVWFQDWALHAPFVQLFEPIAGSETIKVRDASAWDYILLDRPRTHNLHLPLLYQKLAFRSRLYERSITPLRQKKFDFVAWATSGKRVYMASYTDFFPYDSLQLKHLFIPVKGIKEEIEHRCKDFAGSVIGVHIRRTDHTASTLQSPLELFFRKIDQEIERDERTRIYLATDSEEVKHDMKQRYGNRLQTSERKAERDTLQGIRDGVTDIYSLSYTRKIYGSFESSFSEVASQITGVPLEIVKA